MSAWASDSFEADVLAFHELAGLGLAARRLHAHISTYGLTATSEALERDPAEVLSWIRTRSVPDEVGEQLTPRRHARRGPLPGGAQDRRRARITELTGLSVSDAARTLGVARDTVMRWRRGR